MSVAIIDYGSGNLRSVAKAFERVGMPATITATPADLASASHIVLPGVGAFADCMQGLSRLPGMLETLEREVHERGKPFLGICVGMQMLFERGHEHGVHAGLGWLKGEVVGLVARNELRETSEETTRNYKIPHMGWNDLTLHHPHPLLTNIKTGAHAYFVHSYHAQCANPADLLATVDYGAPLTAIVACGNIMGTQFHPEKSQETGLTLLSNFLALT